MDSISLVWYGHITFMLEELQHLGLCGTYTRDIRIGTIYMLVYGLECLAKAQRTLAYMHHIIILYSYWLGSRTTAVFFTRGRTCSRIKQKCCGPRSLSMTVLLYTFILSKLSYSWSILSNRCSVKTENLDVASTLWRQYHVTYWTNENRAIGQQLTGQLNSFATNMDFFVNSQNVVYLLYWFYTVEKLIVYICFS